MSTSIGSDAKAKKQARLNRFGTAKNPKTPESIKQQEKIKSRAERFNLATNQVSPLIKKQVILNNLKKRSERFGISANVQIGRMQLKKKKLARAERFGSKSELNKPKTTAEKIKARKNRFGNVAK